MTSSTADSAAAYAVRVDVTEDAIAVHLTDGRSVTVPLSWYPRLTHAATAERQQWRLIGGGRGIHWPAVDEDVSVENLLAGKPSAESQESLRRWLASRAGGT